MLTMVHFKLNSVATPHPQEDPQLFFPKENI